MKYLRFSSVLLLLVVALLIPFLSQGKISAHTTTPIGFDQPEFDGAANIAADNVAQGEEITTSKAQEEETTASLAQPQRPQAASIQGPDPYPYPTKPLDSINVHAAASQDTINVSWSLDGPLAGNLSTYKLYRNGTFVTDLTGTQYTDDDSSLAPETEYCYEVKAIDNYGSEIGVSDTDDTNCARFGSLTLQVPHQVVQPNATAVPVTINLANGDGLCLRALNIQLSYDPSIVVANGDVLATVFTEGYAFVANTDTPGEVRIAAITGQGCQYGAGSLFDVYFNVEGAEGAVSTLDFVKGLTATAIYDEGDLVNQVPVIRQAGSLTVQPAYIRGDLNGDEAVNAADAAIALDITSGHTTPEPVQLAACDVNGDSACNAADSSLILCYAAFQDWGQCGGATTRLSQRTAQSDAPVVVKVGEPTQTGTSLRVPIDVSNALQLAGGNFSFTYGAHLMTATGASSPFFTSDSENPNDGSDIKFNIEAIEGAGVIKVALAGTTEINTDSTIIYLEFTVNSGVSSIDIAEATLNDAAGRDFDTSALQREIQMVSRDTYKLYLPATLR